MIKENKKILIQRKGPPVFLKDSYVLFIYQMIIILKFD